MKEENIKELKAELKRFNERLKAVEDRAKEDKYAFHGCRETGALKRAALDLKLVLTKVGK